MLLLRAQICEIAIVRSEGAQAASGFCSPETGLSAAAILVLFECLEHPEWQIQKDAIMRLESRAARDVVRETLIKHAVGLPDTPAVSSRHDPMIFPAKNFTRRDREIVKTLGVLVREKLEVVGQVQNCCPAELAMKAVGAQWCHTTLKDRNPEVYLAFAIAFLWAKMAKGHVHMHCFAGLEDNDSKVRMATVQCLGKFCVNLVQNPTALPFPGNKASKNLANLNDVPSLFESVISALADALGDEDGGVRESARKAFKSFLDAFDKFDERLMLQETDVGQASDSHGPAYRSSGCASVTEVKAAMWQCCLDRCLLALKSKNGRIRRDAVLLIVMRGANQIKNLASWLTPAGDEFRANMAKLNDVPSLFESVILALADALGDKDGDVRDSVREALMSCWIAFHKFDVTEMKAAMLQYSQCFLNQGLLALQSKNWRTRNDAVQLIGVFAENQIKNLSSWLTPAGDEFRANMAKLNDVPSLFESVISALADALGDEHGNVRGSVREAFKSFWIAFDKFDERLMLQETDVGQASDSHGPAYRSSGRASVTEVKAAMWQCCLDRCLLALQSKNWRTRNDAVQLIGVFAENQIKNLASWLTPAGDEFRANMAKLNDVPSLFESVILALADALGDEVCNVRGSVREAFKSFWIAFDKFDERLMLQETDVGQASDSHGPAYRSSGCASVTEVKAAMWQCCLDRCLLALHSKNWEIRRDAAVQLIGVFAENQIKNLSSWLTPAGDEFRANMAKLNDVPSLFESVILALADALGDLGDEDHNVRGSDREAFKSFWIAVDKFDEQLMLQETDVGQASDSHGPAYRSSGCASVTEVKAAMWQCCLDRCLLALQSKNWRTRNDAVQLIGVFAENQIKNLSSWLTPAGDEFRANMAKLNDVPSLFESVILALADALGDEDGDVRGSVREAFKSFWIAFDKFDERLMLQETDVGQASDSHGPAYRSSGRASVTEVKAAMWQCCLDRCLLALKSENWEIRNDAVQLIGVFAENQIKNLASWLTPAGDEFRANMAKLNDVPSLFESVILALADALGDEDGDVRGSVREAFKSFWIAFDKFDERLMLQETDVGQASDSHGPAYRLSGCASVTEVKAAMWQCCLDRCLLALKSKNWRTRNDAVQLIGMCAENQIKKLASGMKPSRNEVHGFSLTNPAVAKMLGDKEAAVRRTVPEAYGSFLNAFAEFPDCLPFKASCSDGPGPADLSSSSTAPTRSKASLLRCCLQGCMVALQDEDEGTKCAAAMALGKITFGYINTEIAAEIAATLEDLLSSSQAFLSALGKNGAGCSFIGLLHGFGAINSVTEVAAMRQCCLNQGLLALKSKNGIIRRDAAQLIVMCAENQIKNLSSWLTPAGDEFRANMAKLNDVPSLFESVISALADALGDEDHNVRGSVREAFKSFWIAFDKFDERLMLQETDVGQASDSHGPAYRSSGCASVTEVKAAVCQCCLDRCLLALQSKNYRTRNDAVQLIGVFARNQIKNLASWLTPAGDEFRGLVSWFELTIPAVVKLLGDEAAVRQTVITVLVSFFQSLEEVAQVAHQSFIVFLIECSVPAIVESLSHDDLKRSVARAIESIWHTLEKVGEDCSLAGSCLDGFRALLSDDDRSIRLVAAKVLRMCENHKIKSLALALRDPERGVPVSATELQREITSFEGIVMALSPLVEDLSEMKADEKVTAIEVVGSFWDCLNEFDEHVMLKATEVCCNSEESQCIDSLQRMKTVVLEDSRVTHAHQRRLEFIKKLESLLEDLDSEVRWAATLELCKVGLPFAEAMVLEFLSKDKFQRNKHEGIRFAQSTRALAKSVASCQESPRCKRVDKAMTLFLEFIAAGNVMVQKLGLEAVRIIGRQGLPVLVRTLEVDSPEEQSAAAVGLWVVEEDFIRTKLGCKPQASPDTMKLLQDDVEDLLYGKHPASLADSPTSLPVVQAGRDRKMKNWFVASSGYYMRLVVDLPSPWTLVASAAAFVLFSSQHPLAELLSHPNTLVRSHHHRH